jgi:hypothetical protein
VLEFDQFMAIPVSSRVRGIARADPQPCTTGAHTSVKAAQSAPTATATSAPSSYVDEQGKEVYGSAPPNAVESAVESSSATAPVASAPTPQSAAPAAIEDDDPSIAVPEGARCKRLACGQAWQGEETSRGEGAGARCRHHPQGVSRQPIVLIQAIFHEGSKGYLCCKRRVLEFDEFMKIEGCTVGKHLFVGQKKDEVSMLLQSEWPS